MPRRALKQKPSGGANRLGGKPVIAARHSAAGSMRDRWPIRYGPLGPFRLFGSGGLGTITIIALLVTCRCLPGVNVKQQHEDGVGREQRIDLPRQR